MKTERGNEAVQGLFLIALGIVGIFIYSSIIEKTPQGTAAYGIISFIFVIGSLGSIFYGIGQLIEASKGSSNKDLSSQDKEKSRGSRSELDQMQRDIFPKGNGQIESEINEVRALLEFKYTKEDVKQTYIHASAIYYISKTKDPKQFLLSILNNKSSVVTVEDGYKIFLYLQNKFGGKELESKVNKVGGEMSPSDKLFLIVKGGIVELKREYKAMSDSGKFEIIIFNSLIALRCYKTKHPERYKNVETGLFKLIFQQAKTYQIQMDPGDLMDFINSRFSFYANEIDNIFERKRHIPGRVYSNFYLMPLVENPMDSFDLGEIVKFFEGLTTMIKWVHESTENIS